MASMSVMNAGARKKKVLNGSVWVPALEAADLVDGFPNRTGNRIAGRCRNRLEPSKFDVIGINVMHLAVVRPSSDF